MVKELGFLRNAIANSPFPPTSTAAKDPDGFLAWGGDLSVRMLLAAYAHGIFPWYNPSERILWWAPSERMVLSYANLNISHSLRKTLKKIQRQEQELEQGLELENYYEIKIDTAFTQVMRACAEPRDDIGGTWISEDLIEAYGRLHDLSYARSFETWCNGKLVGGLYGVSLGKMFFGESMFSKQTDASKIALVFAANYLARQGVYTIDCQQDTSHLRSMGGHLMTRDEFTTLLEQTVLQDAIEWYSGTISPSILQL